MDIKNTIKDFVEPRFSTEEMERSTLRCGLPDFKVSGMYYDDELSGFPSHAFGHILTPDGYTIQTYWNKHGECMVKGRRQIAFDLIKPTRIRQEEDSARAVCASLIVGLIVIWICIIF